MRQVRSFLFARLTVVAVAVSAAVAAHSFAQQNQGGGQKPAQNQTGNQTSGNATGNKSPGKPAEPPPTPGIPLYVSPGVVQHIQQKLIAMGYAVPSVSGAFGDTTGAALAEFQKKTGLDPGGDLDELTLQALEMPMVLNGEIPPGADAPVSEQAAATGGAPFSLSPRATRVLQNKLTEAGFPTDNVFGIWLAGSGTAAQNFQKAKNLDVTGSLDLRLIHALGLTEDIVNPKPGKLPTDGIVQILADANLRYTGAPVSIGPAGIRQIQTALQQRGHRSVVPDGKWSEGVAAELKKFQEAQKLEPTGSVNLRTLRALGFQRPLVELDQPTATQTRR